MKKKYIILTFMILLLLLLDFIIAYFTIKILNYYSSFDIFYFIQSTFDIFIIAIYINIYFIVIGYLIYRFMDINEDLLD
ncbi:MAG: hypothetical protein QW350_05065 [Candidatus Aenigmatarchaeota archaeon]